MFLRPAPLSSVPSFCGSGLNVGNRVEDSERQRRGPGILRADDEKRASRHLAVTEEPGQRAQLRTWPWVLGSRPTLLLQEA